jgi:hypothetical protein
MEFGLILFFLFFLNRDEHEAEDDLSGTNAIKLFTDVSCKCS